MSSKQSGPTDLHKRMIEVLKANPDGLTENELRVKLDVPAHTLSQFGRRRRELYTWYEISRSNRGRDFLYQYVGERDVPRDAEPINQKLRAYILYRDRRRCRMCGRTPHEDDVKLHIDHRIPRAWGGLTNEDNLWSLCDECNAGKKNFFADMDSEPMRKAMAADSVHVRLGELLKAHNGKPVPSDLMDIVADRDDWPKRTRELRYLGWKINVIKRKNERGRIKASYQLVLATPWPDNPTLWIQEYERKRARNNKKRGNDTTDEEE